MLVQKPRVDKPGIYANIMHLIPLYLMKLNDKEKVEALFKAAKTSVDASIERLIKPILLNIEHNCHCDEEHFWTIRLAQVAVCHYFCK